MTNNIAGNCIVVAVSKNGSEQALIEMGVELSSRLNKALRLVYIESAYEPQLPALLAGNSKIATMVRDAKQENTNNMDEWMQTLVQGHPVEAGDIVKASSVDKAIMAYAKEFSASLIICGTTKDYYKLSFEGLSTAFGLMANAEVPVLALPKGVRWAGGNNEKLVVLVADDLEIGSEPVIEFGVALAKTGQSLLLHCHVHAPAIPSFNNFDVTMEAGKLLRHRVDSCLGNEIPEGIVYESKVTQGKVAEAISTAADDVYADIIVFGRHKPVSISPLRLGLVPAHAMLSQRRPIAVIPIH